MGDVKVSFESYGNKALTRVFNGSELEGKTIKNVLETMVKDRWEGKDITACEAITAEMNSSGGYAIAQKVGGEDKPVVYEPIQLGTPIRRYESDTGENMPVITIAVNGFQKVG